MYISEFLIGKKCTAKYPVSMLFLVGFMYTTIIGYIT